MFSRAVKNVFKLTLIGVGLGVAVFLFFWFSGKGDASGYLPYISGAAALGYGLSALFRGSSAG